MSGQIESLSFLKKNKSVFFGVLQNQREIAENYLLKFIVTADKYNKLFCHWTRQILSKKILKSSKTYHYSHKFGASECWAENFLRSEGNFQYFD